MVDLTSSIIILVVGIILFVASRALQGTVRTILYYLGLALIIIGAILLVIAVVHIAMLAAPLAIGLLF